VTRLEGELIVDEVARMLGAEEDDETARRHAAALLG
jgi:DNA repair ATPase RecN